MSSLLNDMLTTTALQEGQLPPFILCVPSTKAHKSNSSTILLKEHKSMTSMVVNLSTVQAVDRVAFDFMSVDVLALTVLNYLHLVELQLVCSNRNMQQAVFPTF